MVTFFSVHMCESAGDISTVPILSTNLKINLCYQFKKEVPKYETTSNAKVWQCLANASPPVSPNPSQSSQLKLRLSAAITTVCEVRPRSETKSARLPCFVAMIHGKARLDHV